VNETGQVGRYERMYLNLGSQFASYEHVVQPAVQSTNSGISLVTVSPFVSVSPTNYMDYARKYTSWYDNYQKLIELQNKGLVTQETMNEILRQHELFLDINEDDLLKYEGKIVVMCNGELFSGNTLNEAAEKARTKHGDKPYYSRAINLIEFPSLFPDNAH
jgi:hypothetical protein